GKDEFTPPAKYAGGTIDLSGLQINLLQDPPRLTALRKDYYLMDKVEVKKEFLDTYLGSASPLFAGAEDARGIISLKLMEAKAVPLSDELIKPHQHEHSDLQVLFSISELKLKNAMMKLLASQTDIKTNPDG